MRHTNFLSTKNLKEAIVNRKKAVDGHNVDWLQVQWLRYEKGCEFSLKYKTSLNPDIQFHELNLAKKGNGRPARQLPEQDRLYTQRRAVTDVKKKDMLGSAAFYFIPPIHHIFFKHIPCISNICESQLAQNDVDAEDYDELFFV